MVNDIIVTINYNRTTIDMLTNRYENDATAFLPAGVELCDALTEYLKHALHAGISKKAADQAIAWASSRPFEKTLKVRVRNLFHGTVDWLDLSVADIERAITPTIERITRNLAYKIRYQLTDIPAGDCRILIKGDFANLNQMAQKLQDAAGIIVIVEQAAVA